MGHYTDWPVYPTEILDTTDYPNQTDNTDWVLAWLLNAIKAEMIAVQEELGTQPKGSAADVKTRLGVSLSDDGHLFPSSIWADAPTMATSAGTPGEIAYDNTHFYQCYDTDNWNLFDKGVW